MSQPSLARLQEAHKKFGSIAALDGFSFEVNRGELVSLLAPYTTPVYAALEGVALGGISVVFEARYPGIVSQAVFLTFGTLGALLVAYRSGVIRATENFKLGVVAATGGIALLYLVSFV